MSSSIAPWVVSQIVAGTNISISPTQGTGVVTISSSGGGGGGGSTYMIATSGSSTQSLSGGNANAVGFGTTTSSNFPGSTFTNNTSYFTNSDTVTHTYLITVSGRLNNVGGAAGLWIEGSTTPGFSNILGGYVSNVDTSNVTGGLGIGTSCAITVAAGNSFNVVVWPFTGYTALFGPTGPWVITILLLS